MGLQDIALLPQRASFSTILHKNSGTDESLRTITCPKTVAGGKQGHAPCKIPSPQQSHFCVSRISLRS